MRNVLFLSLGVLLILLQSNLFRVLQVTNLNGLTPSLVLPLVLFLGVHEHSMARGAVLTFLLGYLLDLFAGAPIGLFTFIYVSIWWLARITGVRLTTQTWLARVSLGFIFTIVEAAMVLILLAVFGSDTRRPLEISRSVMPHAVATALITPFVLQIAMKLHQASVSAGASAGAATEGAGR
jgi:rod shape-determining protein MreD